MVILKTTNITPIIVKRLSILVSHPHPNSICILIEKIMDELVYKFVDLIAILLDSGIDATTVTFE